MNTETFAKASAGKEYKDAIKYAIRAGLDRIDGVNV